MKRKEILFELIEQFDDSDSPIRMAVYLLDDHVISPKDNWKNSNRLYYHKSNFGLILRDHKESDIDDSGEVIIRESFDSLLEFFGKLGYLL